MAETAAQKKATTNYWNRQARLGYAKFYRRMPVAFLHQIDAFIKEKSKEWEALRDAE